MSKLITVVLLSIFALVAVTKNVFANDMLRQNAAGAMFKVMITKERTKTNLDGLMQDQTDFQKSHLKRFQKNLLLFKAKKTKPFLVKPPQNPLLHLAGLILPWENPKLFQRFSETQKKPTTKYPFKKGIVLLKYEVKKKKRYITEASYKPKSGFILASYTP